jgi:hypothetical protein
MAGLLDFAKMVQQLQGGLLGNVASPMGPLKEGIDNPMYGLEGAKPYGGGSTRYGSQTQQLMNDPGFIKSRIRQIEYDRRLGGYKIDGKYPPHGELHMLRARLKELLAGQ